MTEKLSKRLEEIHAEIIFLANEVEDAIYNSIKALRTQDVELAKKVKLRDKKVNAHEVKIEKKILEILALQQPVAVDLRFLIVALKMNNDLERIGDHAKSIAKIAMRIADKPPLKSIEEINRLSKIVRIMHHDAVKSFIYEDVEMAKETIKKDKSVDELNDKIYEDVLAEIKNNPQNIQQGIELINASKHLERIADLATNICEDVVFMKEAQIIRYGAKQ